MDLPWFEVVLEQPTLGRHRSSQENLHADEQHCEGRNGNLREADKTFIRPTMLGVIHGGMAASRIDTHVLVLPGLERPFPAAFGNAMPRCQQDKG